VTCANTVFGWRERHTLSGTPTPGDRSVRLRGDWRRKPPHRRAATALAELCNLVSEALDQRECGESLIFRWELPVGLLATTAPTLHRNAASTTATSPAPRPVSRFLTSVRKIVMDLM